MNSSIKIAASQRNGRKSRGPKTDSGKLRSRQNAFRHGLNTIHRCNPDYTSEIDKLALLLCGGNRNAEAFEHALTIAENEVLLRCLKTEQAAVIERYRDPAAVPLTSEARVMAVGRARAREVITVIEELEWIEQLEAERNPQKAIEKTRERDAFWAIVYPQEAEHCRQLDAQEVRNSRVRPPKSKRLRPPRGWKRPVQRDESSALIASIPELVKLDRYERRARSRRRRALQALIRICAE